MLVHNHKSSPGEIQHWFPYTESRGDQRKKQTTPDSQAAVLTSEGPYVQGHLGRPNDTSAPTQQHIKIYAGVLTRFSPIFTIYGLNNMLFSQGWDAGTVSTRRTDRTDISRSREGGTRLPLPKSSLWVNQQSPPLNDFL